jgi:hypothetical protein
MRPDELEERCLKNIAAAAKLGIEPQLTLVLPGSWKTPPKFPRGYLLQVKANGDRLLAFKTKRLLAWIKTAVR